MWGLYKSSPMAQRLTQDLDRVFKKRQRLRQTRTFAKGFSHGINTIKGFVFRFTDLDQ